MNYRNDSTFTTMHREFLDPWGVVIRVQPLFSCNLEMLWPQTAAWMWRAQTRFEAFCSSLWNDIVSQEMVMSKLSYQTSVLSIGPKHSQQCIDP